MVEQPKGHSSNDPKWSTNGQQEGNKQPKVVDERSKGNWTRRQLEWWRDKKKEEKDKCDRKFWPMYVFACEGNSMTVLSAKELTYEYEDPIGNFEENGDLDAQEEHV